MAILSPVEAKSWRGRMMHATIILILAVGGLTMVYPFLIMVSGSMRSEMDESNLDIIPGFLVDEVDLYRKFLETKYAWTISRLSREHGQGAYNFAYIEAPGPAPADEREALTEYLKDPDLPRHWKAVGGMDLIDVAPANLRELRDRLKARYNDDLQAYGRDAGSIPSSWLALLVVPPDWNLRRYRYDQEAPLWDVYFEITDEAPAAEIFLATVTGQFLESMVYPTYGLRDTAEYNADHAAKLESFTNFILPARVPGEDQPKLRAEWIEFVSEVLNASFIAAPEASDASFQAFLATSHADIDALNTAWNAEYERFEDISLPDGRTWLQGARHRDYLGFLKTLDVEQLELVGPDYDWHRFLVDRGLRKPDEAITHLPLAQLEYQYVVDNAGSLRWRFATRNYVAVWDELVLEGRALFNTVVYCVLSIVFALLINPMAAYGLSRYQLPGTYKFLLILMATMAFPPMVALLPQYVMLRNFGLMNTFFALLLPLLANGYMIFLLKGFFDSLPKELYEAARIDGAGELRMFFQITMALSKPILAVLALGTFTHAYASFLYPLLVAPDSDMWLIAVWLYQFQQRASSGAVFASVILASIPTLVIFLFVQRTIMKGIVVPTEK